MRVLACILACARASWFGPTEFERSQWRPELKKQPALGGAAVLPAPSALRGADRTLRINRPTTSLADRVPPAFRGGAHSTAGDHHPFGITYTARHRKLVYVPVPKSASSTLSSWMVEQVGLDARPEQMTYYGARGRKVLALSEAELASFSVFTAVRAPRARFISGVGELLKLYTTDHDEPEKQALDSVARGTASAVHAILRGANEHIMTQSAFLEGMRIDFMVPMRCVGYLLGETGHETTMERLNPASKRKSAATAAWLKKWNVDVDAVVKQAFADDQRLFDRADAAWGDCSDPSHDILKNLLISCRQDHTRLPLLCGRPHAPPCALAARPSPTRATAGDPTGLCKSLIRCYPPQWLEACDLCGTECLRTIPLAERDPICGVETKDCNT